uniref:Uncharacterized protein n=1 Tax=viral metagenome TaxID=1070528 RepID=A0A6C0K509_9ZZZZ
MDYHYPRPPSPGFRPTYSNIKAQKESGKTAGQRYSESLAAKRMASSAASAERLAAAQRFAIAQRDAAYERLAAERLAAEREAQKLRIKEATKKAGTSTYRTQLTRAHFSGPPKPKAAPAAPKPSLLNRFVTLVEKTAAEDALKAAKDGKKRPRGGRSTKRNRTNRNRTNRNRTNRNRRYA